MFSGCGAVAPAADGKLVGDGFVVDHIVRGESMEEVLARCNHHVSVMTCGLLMLCIGSCCSKVQLYASVAWYESNDPLV